MKNHEAPVQATYTTDCMRRITDAETGEKKVVRFQEERAVVATLSTHDGSVFHNGARIA